MRCRWPEPTRSRVRVGHRRTAPMMGQLHCRWAQPHRMMPAALSYLRTLRSEPPTQQGLPFHSGLLAAFRSIRFHRKRRPRGRTQESVVLSACGDTRRVLTSSTTKMDDFTGRSHLSPGAIRPVSLALVPSIRGGGSCRQTSLASHPEIRWCVGSCSEPTGLGRTRSTPLR